MKRLARLLPPGWWRWAIGIGLIAAAVANYFARDLRFEAEFLEVPLRPLRVSPGL